MSDRLHKYPGNLKHHKVDEATATHLGIIAEQAELIQQLVDEVAKWMQPNIDERFRGPEWEKSKSVLDSASSAGFKPSEQ